MQLLLLISTKSYNFKGKTGIVKREINQISEEKFDVLIIGGGITGAAIAYEAASRGLSVALFEKNDFGGATSAATSKMIHGGLRYLAKMELKLVRESLFERRILTNIAPNFVHPAPFLLTSYKNSKTPGWSLKIAMLLYDVLSFDKNWLWDKSKKMPFHKSVTKNFVLEAEPNVKSEELQKSQTYTDCFSFCPERLTLAFIKSAVKFGAKVFNYAEVQNFVFEQKEGIIKVNGLQLLDKIANNKFDVFGRQIINCAGPWADILLNKVCPKKTTIKLRRSEGIHLITKKMVSKYIVSASTKSGRHCFVIPWRNYSLLGTTDKVFVGNPDDYRVTKTAVEAFLKEVNEVFGNEEKLTFSDVKFVYGGLRPLVDDQTEDVYESSRKYEIVDHQKMGVLGLITVEGGKYTTSRSLAQNTVDYLFKKLKKQKVRSISAFNYLEGCEIENFKDFVSKKVMEYSDMNKSQIEFLVKMYGSETDDVIKIGKSRKLMQKLNSDGEIEAQVIFAIQNEMALKLSDILMRRTGIGTLGHPGEQVLIKWPI